MKEFFIKLLKTETSLPENFCIEVLTKYLMFDEALLFLFYRKDYLSLLNMIKNNFEKEHARVKDLLHGIKASKSGSSNDSMISQSTKQAIAEQKQKLEHHRSFMNYWLYQFCKYCRRVNSA